MFNKYKEFKQRQMGSLENTSTLENARVSNNMFSNSDVVLESGDNRYRLNVTLS